MPTRVRHAIVLEPWQAAQAARGLRRDPAGWLPDSARRNVAAWVLPIGVGRVTRLVQAELGGPVVTPGTVSRFLSWIPLRGPDGARDGALPAFEGRLRVDTGDDALPPTLALTGEYVPPGGLAGRSIDRLVMQRVASLTVARLAEDLVPGLVEAGRPTIDHDPGRDDVHV